MQLKRTGAKIGGLPKGKPLLPLQIALLVTILAGGVFVFSEREMDRGLSPPPEAQAAVLAAKAYLITNGVPNPILRKVERKDGGSWTLDFASPYHADDKFVIGVDSNNLVDFNYGPR